MEMTSMPSLEQRGTFPSRGFARRAGIVIGLFSIACVQGTGAAREQNVPARKDYQGVAKVLEVFIRREMSDKQLPAVSIAVIEDQQIVWAQGFGIADSHNEVPASAETVYRIGSVSKLFTDIAIMKLVERGELNLDAPITYYLPEFHPRNPFGIPVTLRQLMSHRSGLLREPPVGNYFDPTEPSLAATVRSINDTELVFPPGTHTKYSNAAIAVLGYLLQVRSREPFARYLKHTVLDPLELRHSSFEPEREVIANLAKAEMWTYDGRTFEAPTFELGGSPAGSMYSTVTDLGRFVSVLLAGGKTEHGSLLKSATLDEMWSPQFPNPGGRVFGLGFMVNTLEGHRMVGHGGAIYGFATTLDLLPDDKLGVVVTATKDIANAVTDRIAEEALRLVLAQRAGEAPTVPEATGSVSTDLGQKAAGRYGEGSEAVDLTYLDGRLTMLAAAGGRQVELRTLGDELIADSELAYGVRVKLIPDGIQLAGRALRRVQTAKPPDISDRWRGLVGEYGWDHNTLYVLEKDNHICVLIEWLEFAALTQVSEDIFSFPSFGLYDGERAIFARDAEGQATQVQVSGVVFRRRPANGVAKGVFRIPPPGNLDALRKLALEDSPPVERGEFRKPELVELTSLDPTIKLDIRYATTNNFLGVPIYLQPRAFMQRPAAEALVRANNELKSLGFGLLVYDAYRPWFVTKLFWEATPMNLRIFVADPKDGSRHNRGCAVDLTLYDLGTGRPVKMTGVYDEMSERSYAKYYGGTSLERWHRDLLRQIMERQGFAVYLFEWWHFDYQEWIKYPLLNRAFDQLSSKLQEDSVSSMAADRVPLEGTFSTNSHQIWPESPR
jgi:CubicO group peptidase (beta-lactamase class C family)/D-alanyl-D-alanine dipeptidase